MVVILFALVCKREKCPIVVLNLTLSICNGRKLLVTYLSLCSLWPLLLTLSYFSPSMDK